MADHSPHASDSMAPDDVTDTALAVSSIFDLVDGCVTLSTGKVVKINEARVVSLPVIMDFFASVVEGLDTAKVIQIVDTIAEFQRKAIAQGGNPMDFSAVDGGSGAIVAKFLGNASLIAGLMASVARHLPRAVSEFTDITTAEYQDLGIDDGMTVAGAVFMRNYHFFTQNVPPIFAAFMRSWAARKGSPAQKRK